tara:strand:- start:197 stop:454 length:258 start_codon:yes stop_codon:yes gene_type:complete
MQLYNKKDLDRMILLEGQDIARACWNFAQERNRIPEEISKNRSRYKGVMLVEFPPDVEGAVMGSFENIRFAVRREAPPNSQKEEI